MSLFNELKRRNVLRVGAAYVVAAWLLIQIVETILPAFGYGDAAIRIVVIVLAIGFIPSLVFSWAFEITPEGLKKDADVVRERSITHVTGKRLDRIIMAMLALALSYFAFDKFVLDPARDLELVEETAQQARSDALVESYGDKSIAVLPFVNMSDDASNEYFSDGISEELLNMLAKIPELRVISRSSAFFYKGKNINLVEVANELNVAHILEGSVRKAGNQVRITVQLIEARSDTHLWSETYDRTLDNIFAIQDEIAAVVVERLKVTLLGASPIALKTDPKAYALYLQGRYLSKIVTEESLQEAVRLFKDSLEIDPRYAPAWLGLGAVYGRLATMKLMPAEEYLALRRDTLDRAMAIAPDSSEVMDNLGWIAFREDGDLAKAAYYYEQALMLDPSNTDIIGNASMLLSAIGQSDKALQLAEYQVSRDPANALAYNNLGILYRYIGKYKQAREALSRTLTLNPKFIGAEYEIGATLLLEGDYTNAAKAFGREPHAVFTNIGMAMTYYGLGEISRSFELTNELIGSYGEPLAYYLAQIMAFRGENDDAFEWLEKAYLANDGEMANVIVEPLLNNLHTDKRWIPFLESIGKSPAQLADIKFNTKIPD